MTPGLHPPSYPNVQIMLRDMGVPLPWTSLTEPLTLEEIDDPTGPGSRFQVWIMDGSWVGGACPSSLNQSGAKYTSFKISPFTQLQQRSCCLLHTLINSYIKRCPHYFHIYFKVTPEAEAEWQRLVALGTTEGLPRSMPSTLYFNLSSHVRCGQYIDMIQPYLQAFPREK